LLDNGDYCIKLNKMVLVAILEFQSAQKNIISTKKILYDQMNTPDMFCSQSRRYEKFYTTNNKTRI